MKRSQSCRCRACSAAHCRARAGRHSRRCSAPCIRRYRARRAPRARSPCSLRLCWHQLRLQQQHALHTRQRPGPRLDDRIRERGRHQHSRNSAVVERANHASHTMSHRTSALHAVPCTAVGCNARCMPIYLLRKSLLNTRRAVGTGTRERASALAEHASLRAQQGHARSCRARAATRLRGSGAGKRYETLRFFSAGQGCALRA